MIFHPFFFKKNLGKYFILSVRKICNRKINFSNTNQEMRRKELRINSIGRVSD